MKSRKLSISILILCMLACSAITTNAQFGGIINKVKEKAKQAGAPSEPSTPHTPPATNSEQTAQTGDNNSLGGALRQTGALKPGEPGFIGLSKKPVDPKNLGAAQFTTTFANGDPIYGIVFFEKPLSAYLTISNYKTNAKDMVMGGFDENKSTGATKNYTTSTNLSTRIYVSPEMMNQKWATFAVFPDPKSNLTHSEGVSGFANVEFFIQPEYTEAKKYDLALTFKDANNDVAAQLQNIAIDFSNKAPYLAMKSAYNKSQGAEMNKQAGNNEMPKAEMHNAALEQQMLALLQKETDAKVLKIIITSPEWQMHRNEVTGVIEYRYLVTRNVVKTTIGVCSTQTVYFRQNYNGSGYGRTYAGNLFGQSDDYVLPCEKVK